MTVWMAFMRLQSAPYTLLPVFGYGWNWINDPLGGVQNNVAILPNLSIIDSYIP